MDEAAHHFPALAVTLQHVLEREFELAVEDASDLAIRVAYGVLRHREDAEEVAQEAFARAYPRFGRLRERDHFRAWIVRTTWRLAIDRWRADRRRHVREASAAAPPHGPTAEQAAVDAERSARLWRAVDALPEKLRLVLVLSAIEGHGIREVAALLRVPEGTVKSRLFLARKGLAERLRCLANDFTTR